MPRLNAMTIDVEDYFQVSAFAPYIRREDWPHLPCRIEQNMETILSLLDQHGAHATFFTLGWIAERYPDLVRSILAGGHELASHGYDHYRANEQSPQEFRADIRHSKHLLEDLGGQRIRGYRAPSFSIGARNLWALDILHEEGYDYSSSIYPIQHDHYGMPDCPRFRFHPRGHTGILEIPPTTAKLAGRHLPAAGGGYFRLMPYPLSRWLLQRINRVEGESCMFYFHPWEIDPHQPRPAGVNLKSRFRHYVNLARMKGKISTLLRDFHWDRVDRVFLQDAS
ncbi:XrtA system polysaccharide deacetylase [Ferrovum myxofaciens]|uniref:XrtA system polysaccharide deacetylase n=1 Tax=Ferrovum myxofaciens TaxID=416213 RepID=UPI002356F41C|nr:XrtA system polysaccharide deacetylase [Ferrovum myxofaciens]